MLTRDEIQRAVEARTAPTLEERVAALEQGFTALDLLELAERLERAEQRIAELEKALAERREIR